MQRYFATNKTDYNFILDDKDIHHITRVMRMKTNDNIEVVYNNELYACHVIINKDKAEIFIDNKIVTNKKDNKKITLVIPLLKEQKMDLIIQKSTELGVDEIIPLVMKRNIVDISKKEDKKIERWQRISKEASEQSMRLEMPLITDVKKINDLKDIDGLKIVCSTSEKDNNIRSFLQKNSNYDKITVVVGPEGGLTEDEENNLVNIGFAKVSLGSRIMRVETVPIFILSILNYENME